MTEKRFTVDSDGKWWDRLSHKYVTIGHLFYLVEKLEKENEQLKNQNESLQEELEQCRAVIDNRWSEYLKKKELI